MYLLNTEDLVGFYRFFFNKNMTVLHKYLSELVVSEAKAITYPVNYVEEKCKGKKQ